MTGPAEKNDTAAVAGANYSTLPCPWQAGRAAMSQAGLGVPKTSEHKAKIAAAQRRRHAAARALTAVEAFHRGSEEALASGMPPNHMLALPALPHREALSTVSLGQGLDFKGQSIDFPPHLCQPDPCPTCHGEIAHSYMIVTPPIQIAKRGMVHAVKAW